MSNTIHVIMTCYNRPHLAFPTLRALKDNLTAPGCDIVYHAADDGSDPMPDYKQMGFDTFTHTERRGIGGSLNAAILHCLITDDAWNDDLWMYITDDWSLTEPLDLSQAVGLIRVHNYDIVRLGPIHPDLACKTKFNSALAGDGWWLDIDASKGGYAFATRPFLARTGFQNKVGMFPVGKNAYDTEREYAEAICQWNKESATMAEPYLRRIKIAAIVRQGMHGPWYHTGQEYDVGRITPGATSA